MFISFASQPSFTSKKRLFIYKVDDMRLGEGDCGNMYSKIVRRSAKTTNHVTEHS